MAEEWIDEYKGQKIVQRLTSGSGDVYIITRNKNNGKYTLWEDGRNVGSGYNVNEIREPFGLNLWKGRIYGSESKGYISNAV